MIQRIFVGWDRPTLPIAARILRERSAPGGEWHGHDVCVVVPGAQAARRLARLLHDGAVEAGGDITPPDILTPAVFLDRCHAPDRQIATPAEAQFAWMAAARRLEEADRRRLAPTLVADPDGPTAWARVAAQAQKLRDAVAAGCLTITDVAARCRGGDGYLFDGRWDALARLERAYLDTLAAAGRTDRNDARLAALASGGVACDASVCLVGAQDLNGLERAMLQALASPVCALIPAPEEERDGFDACGVLRADAWHDRAVPIPDANLHFVGGPADEADTVCDLVAALEGRYAREEITVGVGDENAAEGLSLRLAVAGLPTFSPFGRPVVRTRLGSLLTSVQDYLRDASARSFAVLARHPDIERRLEASLPAPAADEDAPAFLCSLDLFLAECLPERLPPTEDAQAAAARRKAKPTALERARLVVCGGRDTVDTLLAPLRGGTRPLAAWAGPIADVLRAVCGDAIVDEDTPDGRQFGRSLTRLAVILADMARLPAALAPPVSGPDALAFVLAQAGAYRLPSDDADAGLEMMGWLELALDDAPVLLLTGLHEGCVPRNTGDDPLLPDSLRARLGLADDRRRRARDAFLLRVLLESRTDIHLIVARRGADGSPKMPSRLLFACDAPVAALRARQFAKSDAGAARPLFAPGAGRRLLPPAPPPGGIHTLRVTGFRDYLACPYRFYLRHVLKLDAPDDSPDEMDARLFGILLHDCLDGFAHSDASDCADPERIRDELHGELRRQAGRRFGVRLPPLLELQIRQAGRRLDAFADWQAQSVRDGWRIEPDLAEQDMTALLVVDGEDFVVTGRLDRVDYCPDRGFRIIDYKTGDTGKGTDERHRSRAGDGPPRWTDLQLPLYRRLMEAQGKPVAPGEMGCVLLSADLTPVTEDAKGRWRGGTGFVRATWAEEDHADALRCAEDVIRRLRAGLFWPPTDPPPFPPSRTDPGRADPYAGLCLDSCSDRADWLRLR